MASCSSLRAKRRFRRDLRLHLGSQHWPQAFGALDEEQHVVVLRSSSRINCCFPCVLKVMSSQRFSIGPFQSIFDREFVHKTIFDIVQLSANFVPLLRMRRRGSYVQGLLTRAA